MQSAYGRLSVRKTRHEVPLLIRHYDVNFQEEGHVPIHFLYTQRR